MKDYLCHLIKLSKEHNIFSPIVTSTIKLAKTLDLSQQSVSRILIEMENEELIIRNASSKGMEIIISDKGLKDLKEIYNNLKKNITDIKFKGKIKNGLCSVLLKLKR